MPRTRAIALWTVAFLVGAVAGTRPPEPLLDVTPAWGHKPTYTPNKQYRPGIRIGYPASLTDRLPR